ncbi:hypothetical protein E2C01_060213 [Portunus trituberculatus]|uniref:Uncharacterized protein n=1 Tax=Portunus trituberculatus TaxID=210409 RepID=A0A5B7H1M9_PORTR|nr:hypothetical protein [Portunus trituberculatus]
MPRDVGYRSGAAATTRRSLIGQVITMRISRHHLAREWPSHTSARHATPDRLTLARKVPISRQLGCCFLTCSCAFTLLLLFLFLLFLLLLLLFLLILPHFLAFVFFTLSLRSFLYDFVFVVHLSPFPPSLLTPTTISRYPSLLSRFSFSFYSPSSFFFYMILFFLSCSLVCSYAFAFSLLPSSLPSTAAIFNCSFYTSSFLFCFLYIFVFLYNSLFSY